MRPLVITALLSSVGLFCMAAGSKSKGFVVTFHLEGAEEEAKFVTPVKLGSEHRQYFFKKIPEFTDKDISWFYPFVSEDGASYGAAFRLNERSASELTGLTIAKHGSLLGTRVLDAPLQAVIIDRPINDGVVVIWSGLSQNHLKLIGQKISHVDKIQGNSSTPSFDLPNKPSNDSSGSGSGKKKFKFFENMRKKSVPAENPYANTQQ